MRFLLADNAGCGYRSVLRNPLGELMTGLSWGLVGGGEGSQIGFTHRAGAELDRKFRLAAGAFDIQPTRSRAFGAGLGLNPKRVYGDWREMLAAETRRQDRLDLVTVATPNASHFEIASAFLNAGFHVLCEKPLTTTRETARQLSEIAAASGRICAVNFGYTGYPMVRQMRGMVQRGELGDLRLIKSEFAAGFLADTEIDKNPRVGWRFDPEKAGVSFVMADMGSHALHMATFVTGRNVSRICADFANGVAGRRLEDDAWVAFRLQGGIIGRLWVSGVALGRTHGLTFQLFGSKGGLSWKQEHPEQLQWTPLGEATRILERGSPHLHAEAQRANRITEGHPEGMVLAFANIYRDLAEAIASDQLEHSTDSANWAFPDVEEGRHMVDAVCAAAESSAEGCRWLRLS
ncbi:MAG: Gfo/Idh/MocA family oxidoreductase [Rhodobacteraceae bacterium]|nr:Gfo/Idh/MocA family oxidoreductase [Paracoccaceae bacterium]